VFGKAGPPVVLIHGWSGSRHYFERNAQVVCSGTNSPNLLTTSRNACFLAGTVSGQHHAALFLYRHSHAAVGCIVSTSASTATVGGQHMCVVNSVCIAYCPRTSRTQSCQVPL
jgi:hypothetical protein